MTIKIIPLQRSLANYYVIFRLSKMHERSCKILFIYENPLWCTCGSCNTSVYSFFEENHSLYYTVQLRMFDHKIKNCFVFITIWMQGTSPVNDLWRMSLYLVLLLSNGYWYIIDMLLMQLSVTVIYPLEYFRRQEIGKF
jgi:hypothetical protein